MLWNRGASRADKERWPRAALVQETRMVSRPIHPRRRPQHQPLTCGEHIIGHVPFVSLVTLLPCWALVSRQAQLTRVSLFPWSSCGSRWPWREKKEIYEPVVQEILVYYFVILCFVFLRWSKTKYITLHNHFRTAARYKFMKEYTSR